VKPLLAVGAAAWISLIIFPWKYAGIRFQGAGVSLSTGTFTVTETVNGVRTASRTGSVSGAAGIITSDIILRLPLDEFWSGVHFGAYGSLGSVRFLAAEAGRQSILNFRSSMRGSTAYLGRPESPLGHVGGGFEYRFTPHIGIFAEAGYDFVDHTNGRTGSNNFIQTNFGMRYAF